MPAQLSVIWSIEHDAWWRPGWAGYTPVLAEAGRYDQAGADEILARANFVKVNECAIPLTYLGAAAASVPETGALAPREVAAWLEEYAQGWDRAAAHDPSQAEAASTREAAALLRRAAALVRGPW
jgi:hypothetical protein